MDKLIEEAERLIVLQEYHDEAQIIRALVDRLKDAEQVEKGLRASIQAIADELGVGDEPRCKWITLEISSLKDKLKAADEVVDNAIDLCDQSLHEGKAAQYTWDEINDIKEALAKYKGE